MKKSLIFLIANVMAIQIAFSQNGGVSINTTGNVADNSAMLDVVSTFKGILIPRMTEAQKLAITSPATGLLIYQTNNTSGFWYFDGTTWVQAIGPTGPAGANGINGIDGATGPQGTAGVNGIDGATGPQGTAGVNGIDGATGPQGPAGANGIDGATGPQGTAGVNGIDGATGPQGSAGVNGIDGATGPQGPAGANGIDGATGATGPNGTTVLPGIGATTSMIVLNGGDIQYKNSPGKGVVLIDANNQCWKLTVDINGNLVTQSVVCP